jgi:acetyl-CoA carboxylase biotin carboxyl carrier protein
MDGLVDLGDVRRLIDIVQRHALDGLRVADDGVEVTIVAATQPAAAHAAGGDAAAVPLVAPSAPTEAHSDLLLLKSPITGVFYRSPQPSEPPFVQVGDVVEDDDPVCLIEAMKIFNEIPAGFAGRLARVAVANEQLVVTGEVLMEFEPVGAE